MGINPNALRFLARDSKRGNDFAQTAMIGRQGVHVSAKQCSTILNDEFGLGLPSDRILAAHAAGYAEELLKLLGAQRVESFDYSDYEGATHVHDFNTPIPDRHKNQYTFLIDGGTLEHVFNFPTALKNCMEMLKVGGTYFGATPANNEMGHGFYQFSPELYFRVFSKQNGFRTDAVFLYEGRESTTWLKVADPEIIGRRAEKVNCRSTYMLVRATKLEHNEIFAQPPLQPDYVAAWHSSETGGHSNEAKNGSHVAGKPLWRRAGSVLPYRIKRLITMSRVNMKHGFDRIKIHCGMNPDPEMYKLFDPRADGI